MRREQEEAACTDPQTPLTAPQQQQQTNGSNGLPENNGHLPASGDSMAMVVIRPGTSRSAKTLGDLYAIFERYHPVRLDDWVEQMLSAWKLFFEPHIIIMTEFDLSAGRQPMFSSAMSSRAGAVGRASCRESSGRSSGCETSPAPPPGRLDTPQNLSRLFSSQHLSTTASSYVLPDHMGLKPNPLPLLLIQHVSSSFELSKRGPALI